MFNKPDPPRDLNFLQILRDMAERKFLKGTAKEMRPGDPRETPEEQSLLAGMDGMPSKTIDVTEVAKPSSITTSGATVGNKSAADSKRVTSENYRQLYLEQRAQEASILAQQKADLQKVKTAGGVDPVVAARDQAAKEAMAKKVADNYRFRAQELNNQIYWWNQQHGNGQYDEATINSAIAALEKELAGIPS